MKFLTGKNLFILSLTLGALTPFFYVAANPRLITPDSLEKGYAVQVASTTDAISALETVYSHCHLPASLGSTCATAGDKIQSLKTDLHTLQVSYQLMQGSLQ